MKVGGEGRREGRRDEGGRGGQEGDINGDMCRVEGSQPNWQKFSLCSTNPVSHKRNQSYQQREAPILGGIFCSLFTSCHASVVMHHCTHRVSGDSVSVCGGKPTKLALIQFV